MTWDTAGWGSVKAVFIEFPDGKMIELDSETLQPKEEHPDYHVEVFVKEADQSSPAQGVEEAL